MFHLYRRERETVCVVCGVKFLNTLSQETLHIAEEKSFNSLSRSRRTVTLRHRTQLRLQGLQSEPS